MTGVKKECLSCNSFATEDPGLVACPVCGNHDPEMWRVQAVCARCGAACAGPVCPTCWDRMTTWDRFLCRARELAEPVLVLGRRLADEGTAIAVETWGQTVRLCQFAAAWLRFRSLGADDLRDRLELGGKMAEHGIGEAVYRQRLADLDARLGKGQADRGAGEALQAERQGLLLALADGGLASAQPPVPEVAADLLRARTSGTALEEGCARLREARAALRPSGPAGLRRVVIGYVTAGVLLVLFLILLLTSPAFR